MTHNRDGKYLVCHQYSPLLWPRQTLLINHTDSFPLNLNIASGSFSTQLSRQQQLIHHREEEMKHVCQPGLEAMKFSKSVFTRGKETWHGMPKEAYYSSRYLRRLPCLQDYHLPDYLFWFKNKFKNLESESTSQLTSPKPSPTLKSLLYILNNQGSMLYYNHSYLSRYPFVWHSIYLWPVSSFLLIGLLLNKSPLLIELS